MKMIQERIECRREFYLRGEIRREEYVAEHEKDRTQMRCLQSREGEDLIKLLEPLVDFAARWRAAQEVGPRNF